MYARARNGGEKATGTDERAEGLQDGWEMGSWGLRGCLGEGWERTGGPS